MDDGSEDGSAEPAETGLVCGKCGYDLRATPRKCPECGTVPFDIHRYRRRLANEWPDESIPVRKERADELPEMLLSTIESQEAWFLRDQLIARGINAWLETSRVDSPYQSYLQQDKVFHVMVFSGDTAAAKSYLERVRSPE